MQQKQISVYNIVFSCPNYCFISHHQYHIRTEIIVLAILFKRLPSLLIHIFKQLRSNVLIFDPLDFQFQSLHFHLNRSPRKSLCDFLGDNHIIFNYIFPLLLYIPV